MAVFPSRVRREIRANDRAYVGGLRRRAWMPGIVAGMLAIAVGPPTGAGEPSGQTQAEGVVFHDTNGNGLLDDGEAGLPDVLVSNQLEVVKTDGSGRW